MRVVSLFSGAGGLDLGLVQAEHQIVWANDIFADAVDTYRHNIGKHIDTRDIRNICSSEIPSCDLIAGGFPCQGFSVANWGRTVADPRNQIYKEFVRVVKDKKPKYFLGENVKGLISLGKGKALQQIVRDFTKVGYQVQHCIVNAAYYGVPQMRVRLLILGIRKDVAAVSPFPPTPTHANPDNAQELGREPWLTVGEALAHFPEPETDENIPNHECSKYKLRFNGHLGHRWIDPSRPAPTVTGRGDERGGVVVLHHPGNHRRMTARELAAVQSFPDDFVFSGNKTSAYRQIANAVPPALGYAIGIMFSETEEKRRRKKTRSCEAN